MDPGAGCLISRPPVHCGLPCGAGFEGHGCPFGDGQSRCPCEPWPRGQLCQLHCRQDERLSFRGDLFLCRDGTVSNSGALWCGNSSAPSRCQLLGSDRCVPENLLQRDLLVLLGAGGGGRVQQASSDMGSQVARDHPEEEQMPFGGR